MSASAEVLFANETFYHLFRIRDLEGMADFWAERTSVTCIHPGWHALRSRDEVMESWEGILSNPDSPRVSCRGARAHMNGDMGVVVCYEMIGDSVLVATNIFAREDGAWKIVHHQAGPCNLPPAELEEEPEPDRVQ